MVVRFTSVSPLVRRPTGLPRRLPPKTLPPHVCIKAIADAISCVFSMVITPSCGEGCRGSSRR
jgi:hypothetical protein